MIGCGALPATLFWVRDHYSSVHCVGLDVDSRCVRLAADIVEHLGLTRLSISDGDGRDLDYGDADFIYVANQVTPKRQVLERIAKTATRMTQVVVRNPMARGVLLAECVRDDLPEGFSAVGAGRESSVFLSEDLLLRLD